MSNNNQLRELDVCNDETVIEKSFEKKNPPPSPLGARVTLTNNRRAVNLNLNDIFIIHLYKYN